jgi:hypothetical protein
MAITKQPSFFFLLHDWLITVRSMLCHTGTANPAHETFAAFWHELSQCYNSSKFAEG